MGYFKNPLELSVGLAASPGVFTSSLRFPHKRTQGSFLQGTASMSLQYHQRGGRQAQLSSCIPHSQSATRQGLSPTCGVIALAYIITPLPGTSPRPTPSALSLGRHPGPCHHPSPWISAKSDDDRSLPTHSFRVIFLQGSPRRPDWLSLGCGNVR